MRATDLVCLLLALLLGCTAPPAPPAPTPDGERSLPDAGAAHGGLPDASDVPDWVARVVRQRATPDSTFVPTWGELCWVVRLRPGLPPERVRGAGRAPGVALRAALDQLEPGVPGALLCEFLAGPGIPTRLRSGHVVWRGRTVPAGVAVDIPLVPGACGIEVRFPGARGLALPSDALLDDRSAPDDLIRLAIQRAGYKPFDWEQASSAEVFQTWAVLVTPAGEVVPWKRYGLERPELSQASIERAIVASALRLERNTDKFGKFAYSFTLTGRKPPRSAREYNLVRHAGTAWQMLDLANQYDLPAVGAAADRALVWLEQWLEVDERGARIRNDGKVKLGSQALALLAYVAQAHRVGLEPSRELRAGLVREILSRQDPSGLFLLPEGGLEPSPYFPGEACLALAELGMLEGDSLAIAAAGRGVDALMQRGTDGRGTIRRDNWLPQAVEALHRADGDARWVEYAYALGERITRDQYVPGPGVRDDFVGGMPVGYTPSGSSTAAFLEGLGAACAVLRRARDPRLAELRPFLETGLAFVLQTQVLPEEEFLCRDPFLVVGGFRAGLINGTFRIDFDQHAIGALLWGIEVLVQP